MLFLDEATIHVASGMGGHGCVSFRREACLPRGGPDGGNGGRGGDVILRATATLNTLIDFRYRAHFKAKSGGGGAGKNRTGADAPPVILDVPVGCVVLADDKKTQLASMEREGQTYCICRGGRGGAGNASFKSSKRQAPRFAQKGAQGVERIIHLRLKMIADVGLVGCPNAGKSTLLKSLTNAKSRSADYPFTTLHAQLGIYEHGEGELLILADIPGLISDAHAGAGLGTRFLGHIERCALLLYVIDASANNPLNDWHILRQELAHYDESLLKKSFMLALNKADICDEARLHALQKELQDKSGGEVYVISALRRHWSTAFLKKLRDIKRDVRRQSSWHPLDGYKHA